MNEWKTFVYKKKEIELWKGHSGSNATVGWFYTKKKRIFLSSGNVKIFTLP